MLGTFGIMAGQSNPLIIINQSIYKGLAAYYSSPSSFTVSYTPTLTLVSYNRETGIATLEMDNLLTKQYNSFTLKYSSTVYYSFTSPPNADALHNDEIFTLNIGAGKSAELFLEVIMNCSYAAPVNNYAMNTSNFFLFTIPS